MIRIGRFLPWMLAGALAGVLPSAGVAQQPDRPRSEWQGTWHHRHHPRAFARRHWREQRGWRMDHRNWRMDHPGWRMEHRRGAMEHRWRHARKARQLRHRLDGYI